MRIEELSEAILSHPHSDDWHKRHEALASLEDLFESEAATSIVADDLRPLKLALQNALTQKRLHHAYLFTGTRGVGKTTTARILAKALSCEQGVVANP